MREHLFRGKRVDGKGWVEGYYRQYPIYKNCESCIDHINHFIDFGQSSEFILPETVGEYIGITDKNGRKIFEGDICRIGEHNPHFKDVTVTIEYYNAGFGWHVETYENNSDGSGRYLSGSKFIGISDHKDFCAETDLTVIGNIHEED